MSKLLQVTSRPFAPVICCRFTVLSFIFSLVLVPDGVIDATHQSAGKQSDSIFAAGEVDELTFQANAGRSIDLCVAENVTTEFLDTAVTPHVVLIDPTGASILSISGALVGESCG